MTDGTTPERPAPDDGSAADTTRLASPVATDGAGIGFPGGPGRRAWFRRRGVVRALVILAAMVTGALAGAGYGLVAGPTYRAAAYVAVTAETDDQTQAGSFAQAFGRIADEGAVVAPAGLELGVPAAALADMVEVQTSPDAPLIEIAGVGPDAASTAVAANAVADNLVTYANERTPDTRVRLSVFAPAVEPIGPSSASAGLLALVGAAGGLLLAALGLFAVASRVPGEPAPGPAPAPHGPPAQPTITSGERRNGSGPPPHSYMSRR